MSRMEAFGQFLETHFVPVAARVGNQKHLLSIRDGLILVLPLLIVGSIFLILGAFPIDAVKQWIETNIGGSIWNPVTATFGLMGLFACIGIAYRLGEQNKIDPLTSIALALVVYFMFTPFDIPFMQAGKEIGKVGGLNFAYLGSGGLFVAILSAISSNEIYAYIVRKNIVIKMPESVPPAINKSFVALIPALVVIVLAWGIRIGFEHTDYNNLHNLLNTILAAPLKTLVNSYLGLMVIIFMIQLLWIAGLHGSALVLGLLSPVLLTLSEENVEAFQAGNPIPHILGGPFFDLYINIGGAGGTIVLAFLLAFVARSQQLKEVGRLAIGPGIFNINEPIIFGLPIVMNPYLIVPFFLALMVTGSISYFFISLGYIEKLPGITTPWTMPPILNGYIASNGSIKVVILQIALLFIGGLIYYPFFKLYDKLKLKEEQAEVVS